MKKIILTFGIFSSLGLFAQNNVGIGTLTPNPQAVLDISSDDKGILISRLTTLSRNTLGTSLTAVEDGMLVYDKNMTTFFYWDGPNLQWVQVGSGTGDNWGADVVNTSGTNIAGDGTVGSPIIITEVDGDITNEIELPTGGNSGQVLSTDGSGVYSWITDNLGTDNQDLSLTGDVLSLTNDGTTVDLSTIKDHDWYEVGGTAQPDAITDNIFTQGNVGVGTAAPSMKLHIKDGSEYIENGNFNMTDPGGKTLRIGHDNDIGNWIQFRPENANGLAFLKGPDSHAMVVRNDGFVGINTTAPTSQLDINGDIRIRTTLAGTSLDQILVIDANGLVKKVAPSSPVGEVITFAGSTAPTGFLICNGSAISRTTYADLFVVIGTMYGVGNGTTTFNLPDLRGEFIRGFDGGRGIDGARVLGSDQKATIIAANDDNDANMSTMQQVNTFRVDLGWEPADLVGIPTSRVLVGWNTRSSARSFDNTANLERWMGSVRPRNIAMNYCIKF